MGRRLGQHFLASSSVLGRIAEAACPAREARVLEIGAGRGALTAYLIDRCDHLIAIEMDPALTPALSARFPTAEIHTADVLEMDLGQWGEVVVVGNLPYYITSPILDRVTALGARCRRAVLMMQQEVAQRVVASPGNRDYGYLSVLVQSRACAEYCFPVPPGAFCPPPKVDSAVIRFTPRPQPPPPGFDAFVAACFRQKRKTLRNNLTRRFPAIADRPEARLRAEQLSCEKLLALYQSLVS